MMGGMQWQLPPAEHAGWSRVVEICRAVQGAGGRGFLVGGLVRDLLRGDRGAVSDPRDLDVEVFGVEPRALHALLSRFGRVDTVGEAFTVYKLGTIDVSLPRRESKVGRGHKGFEIEGDPAMSIEAAARRRDFTINAMLFDPLTEELIDPHGGAADLRAGLLRMVDARTFPEDSLRVLRALQFAARFELRLEPATEELCRGIELDDLPPERVWGEMEKLLLRADRPSIGLALGLQVGAVQRLFPELAALVGCRQEKEWHPEGDVWVHTLQCVDEARRRLDGLDYPRQVTVMLAILCHDLGKPATTEFLDGRIRSRGHEEAGVPPTEALLDRLNVFTLDGYDIRRQVPALVADHLKPGEFYRARDVVREGAFRRLARRCELDLLARVAAADSLGRHAQDAPEPDCIAQDWFREKAAEYLVVDAPLPPLLLGRHLLELGLAPGPRVGEILQAVYELQMDGVVQELEQALAAARRMLGADQDPSATKRGG